MRCNRPLCHCSLFFMLARFFDLYVGNCESQLLQTNLRFSRRLSLFTPFTWSRISGIGLPCHSGPMPQQAHRYLISLPSRILSLRRCRGYEEFSTNTTSSSSLRGDRPSLFPLFHGVVPLFAMLYLASVGANNSKNLVDLEGIEPYPQFTCKANRQPQCLSPN